MPNLAAALGLDDPAVRSAYQQQFREPVDASFVVPSDLPLQARLRWRQVGVAERLDGLAPFCIVYALTLTETVEVGILARPIALATIGPWPAVVLLAVLGLVNVLTVAAIAETMTRTGSVRYEGAFFRRVVAEYLGPIGAVVLSAAIVVNCTVGLVGYHLGFARTLQVTTSVPAPIWMAGLFAVAAYLVGRDSLNSTIASAIVVGVVNLVLIGVLALLALPHLDRDNLGRAVLPGFGGEPFDAGIVKLVFGVVLLAYFGHLSVGNVSRIVLRRDPGGGSLIRGAAAAQATALVVYCLWILAVGGAVAPQALIGQQGTALEPLEDVAGPVVTVAGSVFVVLGIGMAAVHKSLALANAVRDWLPRRTPPVVSLARGRTRLILRPRRAGVDAPRLEVTYLGREGGAPRLRLRTVRDFTVQTLHAAGKANQDDGRRVWDAAPTLAGFTDGDTLQGLRFGVEVLAVTDERLDVHVVVSWPVSIEGAVEFAGLDLLTYLDDRLPADDRESEAENGRSDREVLRWLMRRGTANCPEVADWSGVDERTARARLDALVAAGSVAATTLPEGTTYRAILNPLRGRAMPADLGRVLDDLAGETQSPPTPARVDPAPPPGVKLRDRGAGLLENDRVRRALALTPAAAIFLLAEWLEFSDRASFTALLSFGGSSAYPS